MPSTTSVIPGAASDSADFYPHPPLPTPDPHEERRHPVPHHSFSVPSVKIPMVKATMGAAPMAEVEALQLLAGIPIPANLGPNVDTTA